MALSQASESTGVQSSGVYSRPSRASTEYSKDICEVECVCR